MQQPLIYHILHIIKLDKSHVASFSMLRTQNIRCNTANCTYVTKPHVPYAKTTRLKTLQIFFSWRNSPSRREPPQYQGFTKTLRHHTREDSSGRVISPTQRHLPNTQHLKIYLCPDRIRTRHSNK
jgi:hypothetical protein